MTYQDQKISVFVMLSFLLTVPTWWIYQIEDDTLHFFIWDSTLLACKSLIPLMGYVFVQNKILRTAFALYFGLTIFNLIDIVLMYYFVPVASMMIFKIGFASAIAIYMIYSLWDNGSYMRH